jgi:hypothetical protein
LRKCRGIHGPSIDTTQTPPLFSFYITFNTFRVFSEYAYICTFRVFSIDAGVSVVDTGSKKIVVNANLWKDATTDVNDIGGAPCLANIAENVR